MLAQAFGDLAGVTAGVHEGEIPLEDEVAVGKRRGPTANVEAAEEVVELVLEAQVVVAGEGLQPQRLPKPAGTQEDEDVAEPLELADVSRPIDVDPTLLADTSKVCHAVWELDHIHRIARRWSGARCRFRRRPEQVLRDWRLS